MKIRKKAPPGRGSEDPDDIEKIEDAETWGYIKDVMKDFNEE